MDPHERPLRKASVVSKKLGDESVLYDHETRAIHVLNPTAIIVWDLCDGKHTAEDIELSLRTEFKADSGTPVIHDVKSIIERFYTEGLLEDSRTEM
jgi:hypothetical protein